MLFSQNIIKLKNTFFFVNVKWCVCSTCSFNHTLLLAILTKKGCLTGYTHTPITFNIQCLQHIWNTLTCMITLCMFIYTVIITEHVLTWDLNSQPLDSLHSNLPATPPCLCKWSVNRTILSSLIWLTYFSNFRVYCMVSGIILVGHNTIVLMLLLMTMISLVVFLESTFNRA